MPPLPPYTLDYSKTTNYYWSQIDIKDVTGVSGGSPDKAFEKVNGPFGFDEAVQLKEDKAMVKADFKVGAFLNQSLLAL